MRQSKRGWLIILESLSRINTLVPTCALLGGAMGTQGKRQCEKQGCSKRMASGGTPHCIAHGGGRRCQEAGCTEVAQGDTGACVAHGGGRRCQEAGCLKAAASGGTPHCEAQGGGKRCQELGCTKATRAGGTPFCMAHGGGKRCREEDCFELVTRGSQYCSEHSATMRSRAYMEKVLPQDAGGLAVHGRGLECGVVQTPHLSFTCTTGPQR
jgi:hypothetical protein